MLQVISGPASAHWREPEKLRYLLAPIIAKSKAEQERFYSIFDQYYTELLAEATEADKAEDKLLWLKKVRAWLLKWWWVLLLGLAAIGLLYGMITHWPKPAPKTTSIGYTIDSSPVRVGDTAHLTLNTRNIDTLNADVRWQLLDKKSGQVEAEKSGSRTWHLPFTTLQGNPEKVLKVEVHEKRRDSIFTKEGDLIIECQNPPQLEGLVLPFNISAGENFTFEPNVVDETKDLQFHWDFGDQQSSTKRSPTHQYTKEGYYTVVLKVTRPGQSGFCTDSTFAGLRVGQDQVALPYYDLKYSAIDIQAIFGWPVWGLVFLLAAGAFYFLFRWAKTQRPLPPPQPEQMQGLPQQSPDRPPYEIPFRPLNGLIRNLAGQFRLADALRRRQEGLRQEVDVPKTLDVTIAGGGFPKLQFRSTTRPADYLFLVDEQNESSHQGRLLRHLVKVLHDQDVHAEVFYYRTEFFHFWNPQYPQGLTLEQISRLCPEHRLVVFGDAHALLDPYGQGKQALRHEAVADFQRWKQRLLLSPRPPQSWDYREANIHSLLPVFPSDLAGQMAAANFIDNGMAPEDLPSIFAAWRDRLVGTRSEPDVNRRWRSASDHAEYLGYGSDLYRWFCALALYPTPTWEITLAIGAALGIPLNADNLLVLARIPSLQEGKINPRLRKELLADLDLSDEELAREAIANELEASLMEAAPGFVHRALQSNLAVQRFALTPFNAETQSQVKSLLTQGWFNRLQIEDLGGVAAREMAPMLRSSRMSKGGFAQQAQMESPFENESLTFNVVQQNNIPNYNRPESELKADEPTLRRFLEDYGEQEQQETPQVEQAPKPKTINREFWRMIACTVGTLTLVFGMMRLDNSDVLYRMVFGAKPETKVYNPKIRLRDYFFVKEVLDGRDSSIILNNMAVQNYQELAFSELQREASGRNDTTHTFANPPKVRNLLERSLRKNPNYTLAALNLARLDYNMGIAWYWAARNKSNLSNPDELALNSLGQVGQPDNYLQNNQVLESDKLAFARLEQASKHAQGVIYYLINTTQDPSTAEQIYQDLLTAGFFDTTSIRPNLATLLQKEPSRIYDIFPSKVSENSLQVQVNYYINPNRDPSLRLRVVALERKGTNGNSTTNYSLRQEQQAKTRDASDILTLQSNLTRPGNQRRTDSLRAELVRINPNPRDIKVVAQLTVPYRKTWGIPAAPPDEGQAVQMNGNIVDGATGRPLTTKANVQWDWQYRDGRKISGQATAADRYIIRGDLSRVSGLTVRITAQGYKPFERSFTLAELQRMNERLPQARLEAVEQQNVDTRQQQQLDHRENSKWYDPSLPEMVRVSGGSFTMGCIDGQDKDCSPSEKPTHEVRLSNFFIGKYEVTNAEFAIFLNDITDNPTRTIYPSEAVEEYRWGLQKIPGNETLQWMPAKGYEKHPVVGVNWYWAKAYCDWLSRKTGQQYRLPTEAEWEYAARGGQNVSKKRFLFSGSDQIDEVAWYQGNAKNTYPVGQKNPNPLGIYDMSGNVYEWCQDWYGPYSAGNQNNPRGPASGQEKVMRGGSFGMFEESLYLSDRAQNFPNLSNQNLGFRVVRGL